MQIKHVVTDYYESELDEYDFERLKRAFPDVDFVAYRYHSEPYSGNGDILILENGIWFYDTLSHCSCYGPCDGIDHSSLHGKSIEELMRKCSEQVAKALDELRP